MIFKVSRAFPGAFSKGSEALESEIVLKIFEVNQAMQFEVQNRHMMLQFIREPC
jgi:hypothetical protein